MPEISSTMYPFIIAGAGAIVLLLLLVVIVRRRRAAGDELEGEGDSGHPGAEEEPVAAKVVGGDGETREADEERPGTAPRSAGAQTTGAPSEADGPGSLVAWGPDEVGSERLVTASGHREGTAMGTANGRDVAPGITVTAPSGWSVVTSISPDDPPSSIGINIFKIEGVTAPEGRAETQGQEDAAAPEDEPAGAEEHP